MIKITYAITVCNEIEEIIRLIDLLQSRIKSQDTILVQYDSDSASKEVEDYLKTIDKLYDNLRVISFPLNKDFASFKNNLLKHSTDDYIFQCDADEFPDIVLLDNIHSIIESNDEVDLFVVPRKNTVEGLTQEHIQKWRWQVNENGLVNWPDYQMRIYKRNKDIRWQRKVHEYISGYKRMSYLPDTEDMNLCLHHPKTIERQEKQNKFYESI
jgi:glycosyltransferase involved in cell wall biosynthesis